VGDFSVFAANNRATVTYPYLTSHPSYALLLLLTLPIPAVMVAATANQGDNTFYWRITGIVGLTILVLMALARVFAWYVFRFGRAELDAQLTGIPISQGRLGWEMAWKPVLMLLVMIYAVVLIPVGWMWLDEKRTIAALPVVTVGDAQDGAGEYRRVEGALATDPVYWAPRGTGRGGNNFSGAGVLVNLPSGGEALLLAESLSVPDFKGVMKDVQGNRLRTQGKVIDTITEVQQEYYGFDERDFPEPSADGRVMVLLSYP
jgi:hypothetical protein